MYYANRASACALIYTMILKHNIMYLSNPFLFACQFHGSFVPMNVSAEVFYIQ